MVFSSISFIFFILPLFLIVDSLLARLTNNIWRNAALLSLSLLFYIWGESINVLLLAGLGILNYYGGKKIRRSIYSRLILGILIATNLSILFVFKYLGWIISWFNPQSLGASLTLPLGISFFTFHSISYLIDIYRKEINPAATLLDFMTYFCMFPHLVAGPIVRYRQIENDLDCRKRFDSELFSFGIYRFLLGFNKKILIANMVAPLADAAFFGLGVDNIGDAWLGIAAYTLQIYFDFSAYSDMAIGLAAMAGFHFEENFKRPYSAGSIRDFWRRWHISLSSWLRDYLYIPLGGSRASKSRNMINLIVVFFLCGLWHGANITFIIWGLWHGLFLVLERLGLGKITGASIISRFYTMTVVMAGWVFFRASDLQQAMDYLAVMFNPTTFGLPSLLILKKSVLAVCVGALICLVPDRLLSSPSSHKPDEYPLRALLLQAVLFFPALAALMSSSRNPFIYFNF